MLNKKIIVGAFLAIVTLGTAVNTQAAVDGPYLGIQGGWGNTHYSRSYFEDNLRPDEVSSAGTSGLAGRVFGGYQFNRNFALELGFTRFADANAKAIDTTFRFPINVNTNVVEQSFDLVGKFILPLGNCFSLYGNLGTAYLDAKLTATASAFQFQDSASTNESQLLPTFGVGISYDITPNVPVKLGWDRIQIIGNNTDLQSTDLISLGIAYNFGS